MKMHILKQAIQSKAFKKIYPTIYFEDDQLKGTLTIQADERVELLSNTYKMDRFDNTNHNSKPTVVTLRAYRFQYDFENDEDNIPMTYIIDELGYESYNEVTKLDGDTCKCQNEEILTVFTVLDDDEEEAGFFGIGLTLNRERGKVMLVLRLNGIYVKPAHRGSTYWMDLTIAIYNFVSLIVDCLALKLPKRSYYNVAVTSDAHSKTDVKIANIIASELRATYQAFPDLAPDCPAFAGEVFTTVDF
jgi:hypothetical protein